MHLILRMADLQPHRTLYWKRSSDPNFDAKALHVLWYYENAERLYERNEPVFCVDEKPGIQLLGRPKEDLPIRPGCPLRREHEYIRHGTGLLFMIHDLHSGKFRCRTPVSKSSRHFIQVLQQHADSLPRARRIHYILDNDSTHKSKAVQEWLVKMRGRVRLHYTPTGASWLNQAEIALSVFSRRYLHRRVWSGPNEFPQIVRACMKEYNTCWAHPFDWSFTRNRFREWKRSRTNSTRH